MPHSHIAIIGAPLDLGQGRRGVDMGPSAVRVANLNARVASLGYDVEDLGNIARGTGREPRPRATRTPSTCRRSPPPAALAARRWRRRWRSGRVPLVLGGDHSVAVGTVSGVSQHFRAAAAERRA